MGDPKKLKKKYSTPAHPWQKSEIEFNKEIKNEYGLRVRKEILIATSFLKKYKNIAKSLIANTTKQGEKEKVQMMEKLQKLGLLQANAELDDVLSLKLNDVLERRIQSLIFRKGLARTMKQARQFIVHRHIFVGDREITFPSYLISLEEEAKISFKEKSPLSSEDHPERASPDKKDQEEIQKIREHQKKSAEEIKEAENDDLTEKDLITDEEAKE